MGLFFLAFDGFFFIKGLFFYNAFLGIQILGSYWLLYNVAIAVYAFIMNYFIKNLYIKVNIKQCLQ